MSLSGLRVAITGSRRAGELARIIKGRGGEAFLAPTVGITLTEGIADVAPSIVRTILDEHVDYTVFMTGPSVYSIISAARESAGTEALVRAIVQTTVVARSPKVKAALAANGIRVDMMPNESTSDGILRLLKDYGLRKKKVIVCSPENGSPSLRVELQSAGAKVFEVSPYSYTLKLDRGGERLLEEMQFKCSPPDEEKVVALIRSIRDGSIDAVTFTSPPSVRGLFLVAKERGLEETLRSALNEGVIVVAIGPPTKNALTLAGVDVDVIPEVYKLGQMVEALSRHVRDGKRKVRPRPLLEDA